MLSEMNPRDPISGCAIIVYRDPGRQPKSLCCSL